MTRSPSLVAKWSPSIFSAERADGVLIPTSNTSSNAGRTSRPDGETSILFWRISNLSFDCHGLKYNASLVATNLHLWRAELTCFWHPAGRSAFLPAKRKQQVEFSGRRLADKTTAQRMRSLTAPRHSGNVTRHLRGKREPLEQ